MSTIYNHPWQGVWALDQAIGRRQPRPRSTGVTMVIDCGLGSAATDDLLEVVSPYVDHWKFAFGTSALMPEGVLRSKLAKLAELDILAYPGGTLLEAAIVQQHCRVYMQRAKELGFRAVEISEGSISLAGGRRQRVVDCALDAGLVAITEVGKKDPAQQPSPAELAEQALKDLEWGASWVVVEGRESGCGVGIYDAGGGIRRTMMEDIVRTLGQQAVRLIWEAPQQSQQAALIRRFGVGVNLGNVEPAQCLALEALRLGLRFETLAPIAEGNIAAGSWDPAQVEPEARASVSPAAGLQTNGPKVAGGERG
jgi:phosphosulfolactate synthase